MAQQLDRELSPHKARSGPKPIYPWDKWANGAVWEVKRGEDFRSPPQSFRAQLSIVAAKRGMKVTTRVSGDVIWFRFFDPSEISAEPAASV